MATVLASFSCPASCDLKEAHFHQVFSKALAKLAENLVADDVAHSGPIRMLSKLSLFLKMARGFPFGAALHQLEEEHIPLHICPMPPHSGQC